MDNADDSLNMKKVWTVHYKAAANNAKGARCMSRFQKGDWSFTRITGEEGTYLTHEPKGMLRPTGRC